MHPRDRQLAFIEKFSIIPDLHERLAAVSSHKVQLEPLSPEDKVDANLVPGCVSRVWLSKSIENGHCRFRMDAQSALVKGLAAALCELYDKATPQEILDTEPELFEKLGIACNLSPTRLNGLINLTATMREFARQHLSA